MSFLFNKLSRYYDVFMTATGLSNEDVLLIFLGDVKNLKVGDIGGGTGTLAKILTVREADVTIIDPCTSMTEIAREKCPGIKIVSAGAENIPIDNDYFDIVCMRDCLHHIHYQENAIREVVRVLKPRGMIVIQEFVPDALISGLIYVFERLFGEKTHFIRPDKLSGIMICNFLKGQIYRISSFEYVFVGCKIEQASTVL